MRIISGEARGRKLKEPKDFDIRPTSDMVKESIFNIIQFDVEGRRALDLFAGTGQLGIEALSRGAREVVFIDSAAEAIAITRENVKLAGFDDRATVLRASAESYIAPGLKFDLIFLDPPYDSKLIDEMLVKIIEFDILKENGIIICETRAARVVPEAAEGYRLREYRYGKIKIAVYRKATV